MVVPRIGPALLVGFVLAVPSLIWGAGSGPVAAGDATPPAVHGGHALAVPAPDDRSPYADRFEETAAIRSLTPEQIAEIGRGEGAGFALPAELNGVPGPRHVLDLAAELDLTPEQVERVQEVVDAMRAEAVSAGDRYLAAVLALEDGFRDGALGSDELRSLVAEAKRREGELATAHLAAHLETAALLTPEQIAAYGRLRGYT
ncbi:MAG: hypothetical protein AVDCRST_MAG59-697 [uncultured Thermomicrobiales bacterium]|uniref:Uncharacterized protein n=1 Tax=uncultured Thermomicrobiales bacterium TaxID=1645740 RepID=A0A6J4U649_9BACT|nr:MAG: hypothetical protein AVDCRST_MAG59-697 [uncultured Thermomicrobiales bacterium]